MFLPLLFLLAGEVKAQTERDFVRQIEQKQRAFDDAGALAVATQAAAKYPSSFDILILNSFLNTTLALNEPNEKKQWNYLQAADSIADNLLKNFAHESLSYTAKATSLGGMAITQPAKKKIDIAYQIKTHIDKAITLDKNSAIAWHVLGRWSYEMASIGKTSRFFASFFLRSLPNASMNDAIKFLYKSYTLKKDFAPNYLFLAKSYKKIGNLRDSQRFINEGKSLKPMSSNDRKIIAQINELSH